MSFIPRQRAQLTVVTMCDRGKTERVVVRVGHGSLAKRY